MRVEQMHATHTSLDPTLLEQIIDVGVCAPAAGVAMLAERSTAGEEEEEEGGGGVDVSGRRVRAPSLGSSRYDRYFAPQRAWLAVRGRRGVKRLVLQFRSAVRMHDFLAGLATVLHVRCNPLPLSMHKQWFLPGPHTEHYPRLPTPSLGGAPADSVHRVWGRFLSVFETSDLDGSGEIEMDEVARMMCAANLSVSPQLLDHLVKCPGPHTVH